MNCKRAQSDIALWAGNDLEEATLLELQNHLEVCPGCRAYLEDMRGLMRLMEECPLRGEVDETCERALGPSLWPVLSARLVSIPAPRTDRFNGWVPAVAVAAVCLAMVLVASPPQFLSPHEATEMSVAVEVENDWTRDPVHDAGNVLVTDYVETLPKPFRTAGLSQQPTGIFPGQMGDMDRTIRENDNWMAPQPWKLEMRVLREWKRMQNSILPEEPDQFSATRQYFGPRTNR